MPCLEIVPFGWFLVWLLHSFFSIKCGEKLKEIHVCQCVLLAWCHEMHFLQWFHLLENYYFLWITSFCVQCLCHLMWASSAICQCDEIGRFLTFIIMMTMTTKYFPARWFCNFFFLSNVMVCSLLCGKHLNCTLLWGWDKYGMVH